MRYLSYTLIAVGVLMLVIAGAEAIAVFIEFAPPELRQAEALAALATSVVGTGAGVMGVLIWRSNS